MTEIRTPITEADRRALRRAADYIETHGWCQGKMFDRLQADDPDHPPACALGALSMAEGWEARLPYFSGQKILLRYLDAHGLASLTGGVSCWNDQRGRTRREVIDTLRTVADWDGSHERPAEAST